MDIETYIKKHGTQLVIEGSELSEGEHEVIAIVYEEDNAQLIAKSPAMYEAIMDLLDVYDPIAAHPAILDAIDRCKKATSWPSHSLDT